MPLIPIPDVMRARRVLAVQPHYDDNDIGAGGTLAALADAGAEIAYLTVTDDLVGVIDQTLSDEAATAQLRNEQYEAGAIIGVGTQAWLEYPDAGEYGYYDVRRRVIEHIRRVRPDFLFTVDPWLPLEAHQDHVRVGRAVAEAALMFGFPRIRTDDPDVDAAYEPHRLRGVAFYFTGKPNTVVDISATRVRKHRALDAYRAQFTPEGLAVLHAGLEAKERQWAAAEPFDHGEALKVVARGHLHVNPDPDEVN